MNKNNKGAFRIEDFGVSERSVESMIKYCSDTGLPLKVDNNYYWITPTPAIAPDNTDNKGVKQARYTGKSKEDLIDRWAREHKPEIFRAKMLAQFDRYTCRYGEKDDPIVEARKLQDYANRLVQYEEELLNENK